MRERPLTFFDFFAGASAAPAAAGPGAWHSSAVLAEVVCVRHAPAGSSVQASPTALHRLIALDGGHVEDGATTRLALAAFQAASADFADYFILEPARRGGGLLHAFDERWSRSDGAKLLG